MPAHPIVHLQGGPYDGFEFDLPKEPGYPLFQELILRVTEDYPSKPHEHVYRRGGFDPGQLLADVFDGLSVWRFELVEESKLMLINHRLREWYKQRDADCMTLLAQFQRSQKQLARAWAQNRKLREQLKTLRAELRLVKRAAQGPKRA